MGDRLLNNRQIGALNKSTLRSLGACQH